MRLLTFLAFAGALAASGLTSGQEALDAKPMTWRGVQLGPEQVFEGDYTNDYETSVFRPDGAAAGDAMWLSGWQDRPGDGGGITRRYHLRFVGRQTVEPGKFGGLGAYGQEVLISRLISSRVLIEKPDADPPAAAAPTKPAPKPQAKARRPLRKP
jgi:hypothetical protein